LSVGFPLRFDYARAMKKEPALVSDEVLIRDQRYDLLIVKVRSVDARDATHRRPPTVVLDVLERMRAETRRKTLNVAWPAAEPMPEALEDPKKQAKWLDTPYAGPTVASAFIVLVEKTGGKASSVLTRCRFPDTPAERVRIMKLARITKFLGSEG
jgi:hypothetical protein